MAGVFDRYAAMKINRDDPPEVRRLKKRAEDELIAVIWRLEEAGFTVEYKKSSIFYHCPHKEKGIWKVTGLIYPNPREYENHQWYHLPERAERAHRRECG